MPSGLKEIFKDDFASSAFRIIDGQQRIVGKFVDIEIVEGGADQDKWVFDLWIVKPDREPIPSQKLTYTIRGIESLPEYTKAGSPKITRLDGEAYLQTTSEALVRGVAIYSGVRRKRKVSDATRQASIERLREYRASGAGA